MDENTVVMEPRQTTRLRPPQAGLTEMNSAKTNSRSGLKPPGFATAGIKPSSIPKAPAPAPAPTTNHHQPSASTSRIPNGPPRTHARTNSLSSSVSARSSQSRATSATSFPQTVGSNSRPPTSRPQTSIGSRKQGAPSAVGRPFTALDTHKEESPNSVLGKRKAWDHDTRMQGMEDMTNMLLSSITELGKNGDTMKSALNIYKTRVEELEKYRDELMNNNCELRIEIESIKNKLLHSEEALRLANNQHEIAMDEYEQRLRIEVDNAREEIHKQLQALSSKHQEEIETLCRRHERELEDERSVYKREINQMNTQNALDTQKNHMEAASKDRQIEALQRDLRAAHDDMDVEKSKNRELRSHLDSASSNSLALESSIRVLKARIEFLESGNQEQSQAFERLQKQLEDALADTNYAKEKLRKEETLRRKLHNQVQELKGNIRVFCRVRPPLNSEPESDVAQIAFPDEEEDCKEIAVMGPEERSSLGTISRKNNAFSFDRVFGPKNQNAEVFEEISQLVQSALDGYNVCIFCYGQTGSGKTHTMSSTDGMIPRAVHQIYDTAKSLEEKGWSYTMEGNFVEVYNENLNDLLGKADDLDKKKHEIRHDMQRCKTTITDVNTVTLDSPEMVESILKRAAANRSVAATKANERSSRSHSVFILRLLGHNRITGERCEGTLNLVDLAGSERLSHSGATGDRLKETQNINKSLSCLGDVIGALGSGKEGGHIPYRNSKLTYLLQFSLGGNSKTLMFVMVSPLQAHLGETLTSLKFATKVHNTHIGTARRVSKISN